MTEPKIAPALPVVLVVDDDTIHLEIIELYLTGSSELRFANNGDTALAQAAAFCRGDRDATILMDLHMPGLAGAELVERLKQQCGDVRIIGMSASDPAPGLRAALDGFLRKPLDEQQLIQTLQQSGRRTDAGRKTAADAPQHLRAETLAKLEAMLPPAALKRLFDVYIEDTQNRIRVLHECEERWDSDCAAQAAHALKGSSGMIGCECMASLTSTLETHCNQQCEFSLTGEIAAIEAEFSVVREILRDKLDSLHI